MIWKDSLFRDFTAARYLSPVVIAKRLMVPERSSACFLNDGQTSFLVKLSIAELQPQSASSRLPGIGVEQLEGTKGEGERDSGRLGFWGGARVLDLTGEEAMESIELRLDLSFPAEGDLSRGAGGVGGPCSTSSGIGLGGGFFFPF